MDVEGPSITQRDGDVERETWILARLAGPPDGKPLSELLAEAPLQRLLRTYVEACRIVERAHSHGIIHCELSPVRIRVGALGEVHVVGWRSARILDESEVTQRASAGVAGYAPPEQATGLADERTDVFALGCILRDILARGDAPPELVDLSVLASAPDREGRIGSARELAEHVLAYLDGDRDTNARRALATAHLERAYTAFGDEQTAIAMREATAALALDPQLPGAAELVGRIMLEPPPVAPPQLAERIAADRLAEIRRQSRGAIPVFMAYLIYSPAFLWLGSGESGYAAAIVVFVSAAVGALYLQGYRDAPVRPWLVAICNVLLIALTARVGSPFLIAPGIAAVTAVGFAFSPVYADVRRLAIVVGALFLAVLAPWLAERAGWMTETVTTGHHGIFLSAPALNLRPSGQIAMLVLYTLTLVIAAAGLASQVARGERAMRYRLIHQTWLLRQLVPGGPR